MNISIQHRIMALFLAFLMFSTSTGYSMDVHYCGDEIKSVRLFGEAEACDMHKDSEVEKGTCCHASELKEEVKSCHKPSSKNGVEEKDCCHNETICLNVDGNFDSTKILNETSQGDFTFTTLFIYNSFSFQIVKEKQEEYFNYLPPILTEDVAVLHQVFIL